MNGQALKIFGIIQMLFSAVIFIFSSESKPALVIGGILLLIGLILFFIPQKKDKNEPVPSNENPIIHYINSNLMNDSITIDSVAEHFKLSTNYIQERVKTETGLSYADYINQKRIDKAKD
tara:strand:- start:858 stop:1217 length:360 start_codon:yes stop_codon:yes gene_type:complete